MTNDALKTIFITLVFVSYSENKFSCKNQEYIMFFGQSFPLNSISFKSVLVNGGSAVHNTLSCLSVEWRGFSN